MIDEGIIRTLEKLDLTKAEAEVYSHLLAKGSITAGQLAKISGYSRPKVYEILGKLLDAGLAESFPSRPVKFRALDPEISIPSCIDNKRSELNDVEEKLMGMLKNLFIKKPSRGSEIFINQGLKKSSSKYCELVKNAEKEIYSLLGWVSTREIERLGDAFRIARENGVVSNLAYYQNKVFRDQISENEVEKLSRAVTNFYPVPPERFPVPNPPVKFLLVDDHSVHITLGDYLDEGTLKDVISVHYYNVPAFSKIMKKLAPVYFKTLFR